MCLSIFLCVFYVFFWFFGAWSVLFHPLRRWLVAVLCHLECWIVQLLIIHWSNTEHLTLRSSTLSLFYLSNCSLTHCLTLYFGCFVVWWWCSFDQVSFRNSKVAVTLLRINHTHQVIFLFVSYFIISISKFCVQFGLN